GANSVVNISWVALYTFDPPYGGNPGQISMAQAIANLVDGGYNVKVVCAAGNHNENVWWYVPADAPRAITVAGSYIDTNQVEGKSPYSSWGNVTAFYAPAQYIQSASTIPFVDPTRPWRSQLAGCNTHIPHTCVSGTS